MRRLLSAALALGALAALGVGGYALAAGTTTGTATNDDTTIRSATVTVPARKPSRYVKATFSVPCAQGEAAIGGGYRTGGLVFLAGSYRGSASSWTVVLANQNQRSADATVYAVCLRSSGGGGTGTGTSGTGTTNDDSTGGTTDDSP